MIMDKSPTESSPIDPRPICPLCAKRLGNHELAITNHIISAHGPLPQRIINKLYAYSRASFALAQEIKGLGESENAN